MKNFTGQEIGFPLDQWIDPATGAFRNIGMALKRDEQKLACALLDCVRHTFFLNSNMYFAEGDEIWMPGMPIPDIDVSGVSIRFSDRIKSSTKKVHPGVGKVSGEIRKEEDGDWAREDRHFEPSRDDLIEVESLILGEFRASMQKNSKIGSICLYPAAIAEFSRKERISFDVVFWSTLAHESYHAFHYSMFKKKGTYQRWNKRICGKNGEVVKESLAATFEYVFLFNHAGDCLDRNEANKMMNVLADSWWSYDVENWPYSGALGIGGLGLTSVQTHGDICGKLLIRSLYDWKTCADTIKTGYYLASPDIQGHFIA